MSTFNVTSPSPASSAPNPDAAPFEPASLRAGPTPPQAVDNSAPRATATPFNPAAQAFRAWQPPQPQPWQAATAPQATYAAAKQPMVPTAAFQPAAGQMVYTYFPQQLQTAAFATQQQVQQLQQAQQQAQQQQQQQQQQRAYQLQQTDQQQRLRQAAPALPPGTTVAPAGATLAPQAMGVFGQPQPAGIAASSVTAGPPRSPPPAPGSATGTTSASIDVRQFVAEATAADLIPRNTYTSWILALAEGNEQARSFLDAYTELLTLTQTDLASVSRASAEATPSTFGTGGTLASLRA